MGKIEPVEIKEFLDALAQNIEESVNTGGRYVSGTIDVEIRVQNVTKAAGGLKMYVVSGDAGKGAEKVAIAKFSFAPKPSHEQLNEIAEVNRKNADDAKKWSEW